MKEIKYDKLLFVEGDDDKRFFESFFKHEGIENTYIEPVGGKSEFKNIIPGFTLRPNFNDVKVLGIIRDADDDGMNSAFLSLENIISRIEGYNLIPPQASNKFSDSFPDIGIFIITKPGSDNGNLEDLCLATVQDTEAMKCVNIFWECVKKLPKQPKNPSKSLCQAYRSAMPESVPHIGVAAERGIWNFESKFLDKLRNFLHHFKQS